ncbi:MAG: cupin, partial [Chloroflexota bacterium]|nr:cupin [Chloroflexota bacterium]
MPRLQRKAFASSDDIRLMGRGRFAVVTLDETSVGRITMTPGWRWSVDVAPKVGTPSCQVR